MTRKLTPFVTGLAVVLGLASLPARAADGNSLTKTDRLLVKAQKICPVSGDDLSTVTTPVKATVGKQTVFLCCKACFKGKVQAKHWNQIQRNIAAAQGKCPVFNRKLPGKAAHVVVKGRKVFVCCPPCIRKIKADPDKYLAIVDTYLQK